MSRIPKMSLVAFLTIGGLVGGSIPAHADRDDREDRCERKIHKAEERLRYAVQRFGENSRQAHRRHEQLEEVRRRCGRDRDHDRDRDRDRDHDQH